MEQGSSSGPRARAAHARGTKRRSKESLDADQINAVRRIYNIKYLEPRNEKDRPSWLCMECGSRLSAPPSCTQGNLARHARSCKGKVNSRRMWNEIVDGDVSAGSTTHNPMLLALGSFQASLHAGKATSRSMRARIAENSTPNRAENFTTALAENSTPTLAPDAVTVRALTECDDVYDSMACGDSWPTPELAIMPALPREVSLDLECTVPVAAATTSPHPQADETTPKGWDPAAVAQDLCPVTSDKPSLLRPKALASIPLRLQQPEVVPETPIEQYVEADEEESIADTARPTPHHTARPNPEVLQALDVLMGIESSWPAGPPCGNPMPRLEIASSSLAAKHPASQQPALLDTIFSAQEQAGYQSSTASLLTTRKAVRRAISNEQEGQKKKRVGMVKRRALEKACDPAGKVWYSQTHE